MKPSTSLDDNVIGRYVDIMDNSPGNASAGVKAPVRNIIGVTIINDKRIAVLSDLEREAMTKPRRVNITTVRALIANMGKKPSKLISTCRISIPASMRKGTGIMDIIEFTAVFSIRKKLRPVGDNAILFRRPLDLCLMKLTEDRNVAISITIIIRMVGKTKSMYLLPPK